MALQRRKWTTRLRFVVHILLFLGISSVWSTSSHSNHSICIFVKRRMQICFDLELSILNSRRHSFSRRKLWVMFGLCHGGVMRTNIRFELNFFSGSLQMGCCFYDNFELNVSLSRNEYFLALHFFHKVQFQESLVGRRVLFPTCLAKGDTRPRLGGK